MNMATHSFQKGDKVHVINSTMGGTFFVEGISVRIVRPVKNIDEQYLVDFGDGYGPVERFVDPAAQDNPAKFVEKLNTN